MKAQLRMVTEGELTYPALAFICPGCVFMLEGSGLHLLPVNTDVKTPSWKWDGNVERPTLEPSILTGREDKGKPPKRCHSFLQGGFFRFLPDSTHSLSGQELIEMPDLPEWFVRETAEQEQENGGTSPT